MLQNTKRGYAGVLLLALAVVFLSFAFSTIVHADEVPGTDCHSKIAKELSALIDQDQNQILDLQLKLTTLKLAAATKNSRSMTVENYIKSETTELESKDKNGIREKLVELYQQNGQGEDAATAVNEIEPAIEKFQNGSYWNKDLRFKNSDLSAFVLAHSLTYPNETPFGQEDAAILWMQSQISEPITAQSGRGSAASNLQEVSTQVARLTGVIQGAADLSIEELDERAQSVQGQIGDEFKKLTEGLSADLKTQCLTRPDGTVCALSPYDQSAVLFKTIEDITAKLEQDTAYLNQKVISKLGASVRKAGVDLTIENDLNHLADLTPKTDLQIVNEKLAGTTGPVLLALQQVAQKSDVSPKSAPLPLAPMLPMGRCSVKSEPIKTDTGVDRIKVTLTPQGSTQVIEYWAPPLAPVDHTDTQAVKKALLQRGPMLTPEERKDYEKFSMLIPENRRIVTHFQNEIKDGPCFRPAR
jgi:hypothetical protein